MPLTFSLQLVHRNTAREYIHEQEERNADLTFLTTGEPSERTVSSLAATPWSILLACSPRSPELFMNMPSANTTEART